MACEIPVIVTQESAQAEVAGDAGIVVDAELPENIAEAMYQITTDTSLRHTCIERGHQRAGLFSWDSAARDTYALLQEVSVHKKR
jgi:glycosyltransferase involved in cell wall biosynthesis